MVIKDSKFRGCMSSSFGKIKLKNASNTKLLVELPTIFKSQKTVLGITLLISSKKAINHASTVSSLSFKKLMKTNLTINWQL